jgi:malonate decarboxylase epsilon subunit
VQQLVAAIHSDKMPVFVGNINGPRQIVVAGSNAGLDRLIADAQAIGARKTERLSQTALCCSPWPTSFASASRGLRAVSRGFPT